MEDAGSCLWLQRRRKKHPSAGRWGKSSAWPFLDIEDYYFPARTGRRVTPTAGPGPGKRRRPCWRPTSGGMKAASSPLSGRTTARRLESAFDAGILLETPREERLRRVRARSFRKFGSRMLEGGDLYEAEEAFFRTVAGRRETEPEEWLRGLSIPVLRLSGENRSRKRPGGGRMAPGIPRQRRISGKVL